MSEGCDGDCDGCIDRYNCPDSPYFEEDYDPFEEDYEESYDDYY